MAKEAKGKEPSWLDRLPEKGPDWRSSSCPVVKVECFDRSGRIIDGYMHYARVGPLTGRYGSGTDHEDRYIGLDFEVTPKGTNEAKDGVPITIFEGGDRGLVQDEIGNVFQITFVGYTTDPVHEERKWSFDSIYNEE